MDFTIQLLRKNNKNLKFFSFGDSGNVERKMKWCQVSGDGGTKIRSRGNRCQVSGRRRRNSAKVKRKNKGTSGLVDWWEREMQEAVEMCKGAKVERWTGRISGRVGGWTSGRGGGKRAQEMQCKGAKVEREYKGTSGRVDWGEGCKDTIKTTGSGDRCFFRWVILSLLEIGRIGMNLRLV